MDEKIKQTVKQMFPELLKEYLMSFQNMIVPQHKHNGVDSQQIPIQNILYVAGVGIPFYNGVYGYNISINANPSSPTFLIEGNQALLNTNQSKLFIHDMNDVTIRTDTTDILQQGTHIVAVDTSGDSVETDYQPLKRLTTATDSGSGFVTTEEINATFGVQYTTTGNFAIQLPDSSQPSPAAGMIGFNTGTFVACNDGATFEFVPTSTGATGAGVIPSGTVELTINGTVYNVLVT